ncbi:hypothetical protein D9613_010652 [Agrocybe pediades]|uniref:Uncharacterized protein n=1 Tax=Agrocybe pediades TaxID=84607 RepID=A0A8H4QF93_9AGAR|nr:hypothetical protein D9613_010652 [Agrocybe pediades]
MFVEFTKRNITFDYSCTLSAYKCASKVFSSGCATCNVLRTACTCRSDSSQSARSGASTQICQYANEVSTPVNRQIWRNPQAGHPEPASLCQKPWRRHVRHCFRLPAPVLLDALFFSFASAHQLMFRRGEMLLVENAPLQNASNENVTVLLAINTAAMVEILFYGIHIVLFSVCMFVLLRNRRTTHIFIFLSAVAMFALSTADAAITMRLQSHDIAFLSDPVQSPRITARMNDKNPLFITNNFISDLIMLYRCYMTQAIWGYLTISTDISFGLPAATGLLPLYAWSIFAFNMVIGIVTVGRVIWISREAKPFIGQRQLKSYHLAIVVLIESTLVYSACVLVYIMFPTGSPYRMVVITVCMRLVAIMPTLLIVLVGLGRTVSDRHTSSTSTMMSAFDARVSATALETGVSYNPHHRIDWPCQESLPDANTDTVSRHGHLFDEEEVHGSSIHGVSHPPVARTTTTTKLNSQSQF